MHRSCSRRSTSNLARLAAHGLCVVQLAGCVLDADMVGGTADPNVLFDGGAGLGSEAGRSADAGPGEGPWSNPGPALEGCTLGAAGSVATDVQLDLFGEVVYFAKGQALPAGRYRVTYVDGCMKFNVLQPWTVNQNVGVGTDGWYLVGNSKSERVLLLPGTDVILPFLGYGDFAACVAGNLQQPPKEFDFAGGKLGVYLNDAPYTDNLSGEAGRNPKWELTLLVDKCPPGLEIY